MIDPSELAAPRLPRALRVTAAMAAAAVLTYSVVALGWPVLSVMLLFWAENVLIGAFNVLKMLSTGARGGPAQLAAAVGTSVFFTVHYGLFCTVHGIFVVTLFSSLRDGGPFEELFDVLRAATLADPGFFVALGVLALMQLAEFVSWRRQPPPARPSDLMAAPYGRIMILHVTIIVGGMLIMQMGTPVAGVLLLIALKLAADLIAALRDTPVPRPGQAMGMLYRSPPG